MNSGDPRFLHDGERTIDRGVSRVRGPPLLSRFLPWNDVGLHTCCRPKAPLPGGFRWLRSLGPMSLNLSALIMNREDQ